MQISTWRRAIAPFLILLTLSLFTGCGNLTDKDRIVIAEMDGEPIRRGDLRKLIRDMDDDKRPIIHNRGDLLRVLNRHIDETILNQAVSQLRAEKKIDVPREQAMALYFNRYPSDRSIYELEGAEQLQQRDFDVSAGQLAAVKADMEFKIDKVEQELFREAALGYLIQDAVRTDRMTITEDEFKQEYQFFRDRLFTFEQVGFVGVRFLAAAENATYQAAECRRLYDEGRPFDGLLRAYHSIDPDLVFESMIENNPNSPRFRQFWEKVTGAEVGNVYGPLFLPAHDILEQKPDGTVVSTTHPAAYVVIQITAYVAPVPKSWEESQTDLAPIILRRKMMLQLREDHAVKVYEDQLPDPGRYDTERSSPFVDVE